MRPRQFIPNFMLNFMKSYQLFLIGRFINLSSYNLACTVDTDLLCFSFSSRIAYYVSAFQSIFTAEGVFHREAARVSSY